MSKQSEQTLSLNEMLERKLEQLPVEESSDNGADEQQAEGESGQQAEAKSPPAGTSEPGAAPATQETEDYSVGLNEAQLKGRTDAFLEKQGINPKDATENERNIAEIAVKANWKIGAQGNELGEAKRMAQAAQEQQEEMLRRLQLVEEQAFFEEEEGLDEAQFQAVAQQGNYGQAALMAAEAGDWNRFTQAVSALAEEGDVSTAMQLMSWGSDLKTQQQLQPFAEAEARRQASSERQNTISVAWQNAMRVVPDLNSYADPIMEIMQERPSLVRGLESGATPQEASEVILTLYEAARQRAAGNSAAAEQALREQERQNAESDKHAATVTTGTQDAPTAGAADAGDRFKALLKDDLEARRPARAW